MRNHEHSSPAQKPVDRFLHETLRLGVQRRRSLVQDENGWITEQGPCNRDALPLSTREARAAFAKHSVVAVRQLLDERMSVCRPRCCLDLRIIEPIARAIGNVVPDSVVEEDCVLAHDAGKTAERRKPDAARIDAVEQYPPLRNRGEEGGARDKTR